MDIRFSKNSILFLPKKESTFESIYFKYILEHKNKLVYKGIITDDGDNLQLWFDSVDIELNENLSTLYYSIDNSNLHDYNILAKSSYTKTETIRAQFNRDSINIKAKNSMDKYYLQSLSKSEILYLKFYTSADMNVIAVELIGDTIKNTIIQNRGLPMNIIDIDKTLFIPSKNYINFLLVENTKVLTMDSIAAHLNPIEELENIAKSDANIKSYKIHLDKYESVTCCIDSSNYQLSYIFKPKKEFFMDLETIYVSKEVVHLYESLKPGYIQNFTNACTYINGEYDFEGLNNRGQKNKKFLESIIGWCDDVDFNRLGLPVQKMKQQLAMINYGEDYYCVMGKTRLIDREISSDEINNMSEEQLVDKVEQIKSAILDEIQNEIINLREKHNIEVLVFCPHKLFSFRSMEYETGNIKYAFKVCYAYLMKNLITGEIIKETDDINR